MDKNLESSRFNVLLVTKRPRSHARVRVLGQALTILQAHEAVPVLKLCANHESLQTRVWVLQAIGNLGSRADVPFLAKHLNASDMLERASAAQGIENLANVDFEFPKVGGIYNPEAAIKRAKDWWEKSKSAFNDAVK